MYKLTDVSPGTVFLICIAVTIGVFVTYLTLFGVTVGVTAVP